MSPADPWHVVLRDADRDPDGRPHVLLREIHSVVSVHDELAATYEEILVPVRDFEKVTSKLSNIDKLIWSIPETIEHLSGLWALQPGDLIYSGTPEGVGPVEKGETMTGGVDGVGDIEIRIT